VHLSHPTETVRQETQHFQRQPDVGVRLMLTVDGLDEIVWWVLGWSGRAKVHAPEDPRDMVVGRLRDAMQLNAGL
jgi:predicted DNA-binding transcriptional regulator YafY